MLVERLLNRSLIDHVLLLSADTGHREGQDQKNSQRFRH
jgi:hypothetical protein